MSGQGNVTACDQVSVPNTNKTALQVLTDSSDPRYAVYIEFIADVNQRPKIGDQIKWTTGSVFWNGKKLRKIGYAFDPNAPLT